VGEKKEKKKKGKKNGESQNIGLNSLANFFFFFFFCLSMFFAFSVSPLGSLIPG